MSLSNQVFRGSLALLAMTWISSSVSWAYNPFTHERFTRLALRYAKNHISSSSPARLWFSLPPKELSLLEETLVRGNVESDYHPDLWMQSMFHSPAAGLLEDGVIHMFTPIFHFLNITKPGRYWEYDGFSYDESSKHGKDRYIGLPSLRLLGKLSPALNGTSSLGLFSLGFKGYPEDWKKMYLSTTRVSEVVFPPANVPAQLAFEAMMQSPRAFSNTVENSVESLPLISSIVHSKTLTRKVSRFEVKGLPRLLDKLGFTLHLLQDMTVPHHTLGTADLCHEEFEDFTDQLSCPQGGPIDHSKYHSGTFYGDTHPECTQIYDERLVSELIENLPFLDIHRRMPISERFFGLALHTSQWKWEHQKGRYDFATTLSTGNTYEAGKCSDLLSMPQIQKQVRYQYNLAIAATVVVFLQAAQEYEQQRNHH